MGFGSLFLSLSDTPHTARADNTSSPGSRHCVGEQQWTTHTNHFVYWPRDTGERAKLGTSLSPGRICHGKSSRHRQLGPIINCRREEFVTNRRIPLDSTIRISVDVELMFVKKWWQYCFHPNISFSMDQHPVVPPGHYI